MLICKADILQVLKRFWIIHGAVSEETAIAMAEGCRQVTGADLACFITGVAGPDGGTEENLWFSLYRLADASGSYARKFHFLGNRNKVRKIAALNAFNMAATAIKSISYCFHSVKSCAIDMLVTSYRKAALIYKMSTQT